MMQGKGEVWVMVMVEMVTVTRVRVRVRGVFREMFLVRQWSAHAVNMWILLEPEGGRTTTTTQTPRPSGYSVMSVGLGGTECA